MNYLAFMYNLAVVYLHIRFKIFDIHHYMSIDKPLTHFYFPHISILYPLQELLMMSELILHLLVHHLTYILPVYHDLLFLYIHFTLSHIHHHIHMNICYLLLHLVFYIMCLLHLYLDYLL